MYMYISKATVLYSAFTCKWLQKSTRALQHFKVDPVYKIGETFLKQAEKVIFELIRNKQVRKRN